MKIIIKKLYEIKAKRLVKKIYKKIFVTKKKLKLKIFKKLILIFNYK